MATERIIPGEIRIFLNHIYEFKKGVRNMVLYTMSREHEEFAIHRQKNQKISYMAYHHSPLESTVCRRGLHLGSHAGIRPLPTMQTVL